MDRIIKEDLRQLIDSNEGPCVSLYMPTSRNAGNDVNKMKIRMKSLIKSVDNKIRKVWNYNSKQSKEFLQPLYDLTSDRNFWFNQSLGLAIFLSKEQFSYYRLPLNFEKESFVSDNFVIKQLIPELFEDRKFYILTISKNNNNLFRCTKEDIREIELENSPDSIEDTLKYDDPEKSIQYHSNSDNGSAIYHGQGVTDEDNKEDFMRYLREIDEAVYDYLHNSNAPLIIMSVEEIFPLYKRVNSYANLLDEFVKGSPDKISKEKILNKSLTIVNNYIQNYKNEALNKYSNMTGSDKTEEDFESIIKNAYYGKIDFLLVQSKKEKRGFYDLENDKIEYSEKNRSIDLYNDAVIQTILNGGEVYILNEEEIPDNLEIAAVYRY